MTLINRTRALLAHYGKVRGALMFGSLTLLLSSVCQQASAEVIAISSALNMRAEASVITAPGDSEVATDSQSQGSTLNTLGGLSVHASAAQGTESVDVYASLTSSWINSAQGQVVFDHVGWVTNTGMGLATVDYGNVWSYTFLADVTGLFTLNYDVVLDPATDSPFGLFGFAFFLNGSTSHLNVGTSGIDTRQIQAGQTYTATISTRGGIWGGLQQRTAFMDGLFNWSMDSGPPTATPEPSILALFGAALLLLQAAQRKRTVPANTLAL